MEWHSLINLNGAFDLVSVFDAKLLAISGAASLILFHTSEALNPRVPERGIAA